LVREPDQTVAALVSGAARATRANPASRREQAKREKFVMVFIEQQHRRRYRAGFMGCGTGFWTRIATIHVQFQNRTERRELQVLDFAVVGINGLVCRGEEKLLVRWERMMEWWSDPWKDVGSGRRVAERDRRVACGTHPKRKGLE
jgi:hypothetical protein